MKIRAFAVEQWMNAHETRCELNLAETCVDSLTVEALLELCGLGPDALADLLPQRLTYGPIEGSPRLRAAIATLYKRQTPQNVLVTHGAIGANALVYQTLVDAGDRIISIVPNYQQHYSIPESLGAHVKRLELKAEDGYLPDLSELKRLVTPGTRLIALSNPNNPTGALLPEAMLVEIADIARAANAWIVADEVYRGTPQQGDALTPSLADLYEQGISIGSMSKSFSLAGLRLGWISAPTELLREVEIHRDYNTISVGMLDDHFAALALEHADKVLARSQHIVRTNLAILDQWLTTQPMLSYVKPMGGTTALVKYQAKLSSVEFCTRLLEATGVLFTPGSALEMEGHVRIGYANNQQVLTEGLARAAAFLETIASEQSS